VLGCLVGGTVYDAVLYEGEGSVVAKAVGKIHDEQEGELRL
jgi:hypothetical protein